MLFALGVRRYPPLDLLVALAADQPHANPKALPYLLEHINTHYVNFDPKAFAQVAFLPAVRPGGKQTKARPGEVSHLTHFRQLALMSRGLHQSDLRHPRVLGRRT